MQALNDTKWEVPKITSIDEDTDWNSEETACGSFFWDCKISLFRLKSPGFLNKKSTTARFWKSYVDRSGSYFGHQMTLYTTSSLRDVLYLYDSDLNRAQKHKN